MLANSPLTKEEYCAIEIAIKALKHCEVWNGYDGSIMVSPKWTFEKIWNDTDGE